VSPRSSGFPGDIFGQKSREALAMATAIKKSRAAGRLPRRAREARVPESTEFLIFEDNGGAYHWTIVARDGETLARSGGFASYGDAEQAARRVRGAATSARFERRGTGALPVDLVARRDPASDDDDAERWLDESGSFSSEAVAKWPAPH
jgi:uncharacterized protein YegP (UPF0339 family)